MLADDFSALFRSEHRVVRDGLLELVDAFQNRDQSRQQRVLAQIAQATGPHFRYEEEALYPALVDLFGPEYIEQLLEAHDGVIRAAKRLVTLAGQPAQSNDDAAEAVALVRRVLPHVSDCDGLSIMVERLPETRVAAILESRDRSLAEGLDLLAWADRVRSRPH